VRTLLENLVRQLVDEPGRVSVTGREEEGGTRLYVRVAPEDQGFVIGKGGRTAEALRTLLDAVARQQGTRCSVEIVDSEPRSGREPRRPRRGGEPVRRGSATGYP
jgi:predicted RNA-binding protein YlqC (UPF0109 family)